MTTLKHVIISIVQLRFVSCFNKRIVWTIQPLEPTVQHIQITVQNYINIKHNIFFSQHVRGKPMLFLFHSRKSNAHDRLVTLVSDYGVWLKS